MKSSANLNKSSAKKVRKPFSASAVGKKTKSLRHLLGTLGSLQETDRAKRAYSGSLLPTWENIEAAPSVLWPKTKYCDLTGLECRYTDPKSKLYYKSQYEYSIISNELSQSLVYSYAKLRNAAHLNVIR